MALKAWRSVCYIFTFIIRSDFDRTRVHELHRGRRGTNLYGDEDYYYDDDDDDDDDEYDSEESLDSSVKFSLPSNITVWLCDQVPRETHVNGSIPYSRVFTGRDIVVCAFPHLFVPPLTRFTVSQSTLPLRIASEILINQGVETTNVFYGIGSNAIAFARTCERGAFPCHQHVHTC
jgi:hypothetical protein